MDENAQPENEKADGWQPLPQKKDKQESTGERLILSTTANSKNMRVLTDAEVEEAAVQSAATQAAEVKSRRTLRRKVPVGAFSAANKVLSSLAFLGGCICAYYVCKNVPANMHAFVVGKYPVGDAAAMILGFAVGAGITYLAISIFFDLISRVAKRPLP
ncbi:MAG: hypothetical protein IAF58_18115 [Leptolyngbya sp.]|nr:hypothetical protein [Candidatus Melainabacteria bacterium]